MLNFQFQSRRLTFLFLISHFLFLIFFTSCSIEKQIAKSAKADVLDAKALQTAHVGISIFDPAANKYLYNYQGDKYFVPASNIKIPTCYAAMKYLGDSLVGARYMIRGNRVSIFGTGDPTFLHPEFKYQPVYDFAKSMKGNDVYIVQNQADYKKFKVFSNYTKYDKYGKGWNWDDYEASYMPEKNFFPIYGNIVKFSITDSDSLLVIPKYFKDISWWDKTTTNLFEVHRDKPGNKFYVLGFKKNTEVSIPYSTSYSYGVKTFEPNVIGAILSDTLGYKVTEASTSQQFKLLGWQEKNYYGIIYSQPTDSLLKPMMHNSDNFFAEQSLVMVSNELFGYHYTEEVIDTLLKTDFKDLPQKPRWADGSGLSRYNLFTPQDFVAILNKMKNEFGMERIKVILPTGGEGTISSYYKADSGYIYGKTGTLSGVVAFSGFLYTKKGKLLIFSTLVNNHQATATEVRRAVEKFLQGIRNTY
jgi:serine-type D-Ala-D-Ala carboxypeptidase/endopeptidase (penicillin-binding protein 4)